jgi:AbrB family looped-hinge helix DNA binding protein
MSSKKVDDLGRVTIPKYIRKHADIHPRDEVDVGFDGTKITITKRHSTYLDEYIRQIKKAANVSFNITVDEYNTLVELLDKLTK